MVEKLAEAVITKLVGQHLPGAKITIKSVKFTPSGQETQER